MAKSWFSWILIIVSTVFFRTVSHAQHIDTASLILIPAPSIAQRDAPTLSLDEPFPPEFPGGATALQKFIAKNIHWKTGMKEGKVLAAFTMNANGYLKQVKITQHVSPLNDAEVLRVLRIMPKWVPMAKGVKTVDGKFTLPVTFSKK